MGVVEFHRAKRAREGRTQIESLVTGQERTGVDAWPFARTAALSSAAALTEYQTAAPSIPRALWAQVLSRRSFKPSIDFAAETRRILGSHSGQLRLSGAFSRHQFSGDYTISMFGFNFRQGQPLRGRVRLGVDFVVTDVDSLFEVRATELRYAARRLAMRNK